MAIQLDKNTGKAISKPLGTPLSKPLGTPPTPLEAIHAVKGMGELAPTNGGEHPAPTPKDTPPPVWAPHRGADYSGSIRPRPVVSPSASQLAAR